jgi:HD-GYP domain-containing protein (c-di-GMP phosphodiesterase class II)
MSRYKTIPLEKLTVGMEVVALDKSWLETNILFHRFRIRSKEEIDKLRENGIRMVTVKLSEREEQNMVGTAPSEIPSSRNVQPETLPKDPEAVQNFQDLGIPPHQSLQEWAALQKKTVALVTKSFEDVRMGKALESAPLKQLVLETVEMTLLNPRHNSFLVTLSEVDDESYVHSTNTMILTMALATQSGVQREEIATWGMAALLHDIGKAMIPLDILKKPGKLSPQEWETVKKHPSLGFSILSKNKDSLVRGLCATVCVEHHERKNGFGYPNRIDLQDLNPVSRSLMVLDIYEALTSGRAYRNPLSPAKALTYLLENAIHQLDSKVVVQLVQMIGIYPVGSLVELNDGRIALVSEFTDPDNKTGPVTLTVLFSDFSTPLAEPVPLVLPSIDRSHVRQTFHPRELGLSPYDIIRYIESSGAGLAEAE